MSRPLSLVRAEIKAWERDFASSHGRDPALQDIRDHPLIAEKYRLYKKLSKAAPSPSTPPRTSSRLPVPKSRPVESVPALPGFNPFSPVKKSAKHDRALPRPSPLPNPFATPAKNPSQRTATPSPDLFPPILPPHQNATLSSSPSTTAVSRARKRLRGEPVSPSPNKPKRQRIRSQAPQSISKLDQDSPSSEHGSDQELPQCDFPSSFVADSPVKAPAGGKSFKLLFDDALPALPAARKPAGPSVPQLDSSPDAGFPLRAFVQPSVPTSVGLDLSSNGVPPQSEHRGSHVQAKTSTYIFPTKDHSPAPSHKLAFGTVVSEVPQPRSSVKRVLDGDDLMLDHTEPSIPLQSQFSLVPPSPPAQDSIDRDAGKRKTKNTASRKRPKVEDEESDERTDGPDDIALKIATIGLNRSRRSRRHAGDLDWEPLLHLRTPNLSPATKQQIDANHHASGTFSTNLPDKFRRVLAISPSLCHDVTEERVVRELLYGDRVGHYDPSRGGDIWDAGETDEGAQGDDWEGEPVPWEIGDL